jgi:hypothetical protein
MCVDLPDPLDGLSSDAADASILGSREPHHPTGFGKEEIFRAVRHSTAILLTVDNSLGEQP